MEIRIELDLEQVEPNYLVFDDARFDAPETWLNVRLVYKDEKTNLGDVRLNDILPALIAFDAKQNRRHEAERSTTEGRQ